MSVIKIKNRRQYSDFVEQFPRHFYFFIVLFKIYFLNHLSKAQPCKGQLISKCPFGVKTSSKKPTKLFPGFCPEIFCTFLGAFWKLFGASCRLPYLRCYLSPHEAQKASRKPPGSCKKIQGRIQVVGFLEEVFTPKIWILKKTFFLV